VRQIRLKTKPLPPMVLSMATYTARYVRRFSCTGGDCPDTCCAGLTIRLTEEEVIRLKRGPGTAAWQQAVDKEVQPPPRGAPEGTYAVLAHPDGECAFLASDRLCTVHKELGPEGLNATCRDYPRQAATVGEHVEVWGSLGCPEMARLAFSEENALELVEVDQGPAPRLTQPHDPSRAAIHALLTSDELSLPVRFGAIALALDAAGSLEGLHEATEAVRLDPGAYEGALSEVGSDAVLRAVVGRDAIMARRPISRHQRFGALVDVAVFARPPTDDDLHRFFVSRTDVVRPDLDVIAELGEQSQALRDDGAFAMAASRYAGWRWASRPPTDLPGARTLWGRILLEIAAAELLMTAGADRTEAFQLIARELVSVPDLDVLFDAYVVEQQLDTLQGQVAARPGPAAAPGVCEAMAAPSPA
jgi:hypothetical protein